MKRLFDRLGWGIAGALGVAVVALVAGVVSAGPLTPPGPPAATQETLIFQPASCADFPIVLGSTGSFKLASDIVMPAACAKDGIQVGADNTTLDLNGFELRGVPGSLNGVTDSGGARNGIVIKNGYIKQWGARGVYGINFSRLQIIDVMAIQNGLSGFEVKGAELRGCRATANGSRGIWLMQNSIVDGCQVDNNAVEGILVDDTTSSGFFFTTQIVNCTSSNNGSSGIAVNDASATVRNCEVGDNGGHGIWAISHVDVRNNHVYSNTLDGIHVPATGVGNHIEGNDSRANASGVDFNILGVDNFVIRNAADGAAGAYAIVAGNFSGTIVTTEAAMNAAANDNVNVAIP